jgi:hypothetical protein
MIWAGGKMSEVFLNSNINKIGFGKGGLELFTR